jgi:hypothetical protein
MLQNRRKAGRIASQLVVEKLTQQNYIVNAGNISSNLSVRSPSGRRFMVKVTSLSSHTAWIIPEPESQDSYYILVYKPWNELPAFFIMTVDEMQKEKQKHFDAKKHPIEEYTNPDLEKKGLNFKQPFSYENNWDSLPE